MEYEPTDNRPPEDPAAPKPRARKAATKKEFLQLPRNKGLKVCILASAIVCYYYAGLVADIGIVTVFDRLQERSDFPHWFVAVLFAAVAIVAIILLALGIGIHKRQSVACAVILFILSYGTIIWYWIEQGFRLDLIIVAAALALLSTILLEKRWKTYRDAEPWQSEVSRAYEEPDAEPTISRKEFLELPENEKLKKRLHTNATVCYVFLGIGMAVYVGLTAMGRISVFDFALEAILRVVTLALVIAVDKRQNITCAYILGLLMLAGCVLGLIEGDFSGFSLIDYACLGMFINTMLLEAERKKYLQKKPPSQSLGIQPEENRDLKGETSMKYVCPCGYEYDPAVGDPDNGIAPGTPFEAIPDSWVCPVCGLGKGEFVPA